MEHNLVESSLSENAFTLSLCFIDHLGFQVQNDVPWEPGCHCPIISLHHFAKCYSCFFKGPPHTSPRRPISSVSSQCEFHKGACRSKIFLHSFCLEFSTSFPSESSCLSSILDSFPTIIFFPLHFLCSHYLAFSEESKPGTGICSEISAILFP